MSTGTGNTARLSTTSLLASPLIVKWPESSTTGRSAELFSQVDIFATLVEAAGLELPVTEEGFPRQALAGFHRQALSKTAERDDVAFP